MIKKIKESKLYIWCFCLLMLFNTSQVYAADCNGIFGDPNDPKSIANLLSWILGFFRVAAPILVISLGSVDLFKAVIAQNEGDMKKAQTVLMKRVVLGVALFFVPALVNFIIDAASQHLGYDACMFRW